MTTGFSDYANMFETVFGAKSIGSKAGPQVESKTPVAATETKDKEP